jgi:hypothetical protein
MTKYFDVSSLPLRVGDCRDYDETTKYIQVPEFRPVFVGGGQGGVFRSVFCGWGDPNVRKSNGSICLVFTFPLIFFPPFYLVHVGYFTRVALGFSNLRILTTSNNWLKSMQ